MEKLLIFRERILKFLSSNGRVLRLAGKFIGGALLFYVAGEMYAYGSLLSQPFMFLILGIACIFLPVSVIFLLYHLIVAFQLSALAMEIGILYLIVIGLYYLIYQRMFKKTELLLLMTPVLFYFHIPAVLPIVVGSFIGLYGLPAILMGSCCYYFAVTVQEGIRQMSGGGNEGGQIYSLIMSSTAENKELMLGLLVFIIVTAAVAGIRKLWIAYGWYIAILAGGGLYLFAVLTGGYFLVNEVHIVPQLLMILASLLIVMAGQFLYSVIDYTREENFEYEDEEYYYYVRAIPKISMEEEMSVKKVIVPARRFYLKHKEKHDDKGEES